MRKITVEIVPDERIRAMMRPLMEHIEEMELIELLRLDLKRGIKVGVVRIRLAPGSTVESIGPTSLFDIKMVDVLERKGDELICLMKVKARGGFEDLREKADLDISWTAPMMVSRDRIVYSFIGEEDQIKAMVELLKEFGERTRVSVHNATFGECNTLSMLTVRQKEIVVAAKRLGYYRYPREANAEDVAKALGLSTSTVVEHLRKAEIRLIADVLSGY